MKRVKYQIKGSTKYYDLWAPTAQDLLTKFEAWKERKMKEDPTFQILDEGSRIKISRQVLEINKNRDPAGEG